MGSPGLSGMNITEMKRLLRRIDRLDYTLRRGKRRALCMAINEACQDGLLCFIDGKLKPQNRKENEHRTSSMFIFPEGINV
jgi:hypothetical protein